MRILYDADGKTCRITVREAGSMRFLDLDDCEEGAMDLEHDRPVFQYLWFCHASRLARRRPRQALVLGAGAFTAAKCLALAYPEAGVDAVDVEPELELAGRQFFRLDRPEFARIAFHAVPAEEFLAGATHTYDFVFDDLFDGHEHVPVRCRALEHFQQLRRVLVRGGVCVKNLIWNPHSADARAACAEAAAGLASAFAYHAVLALGQPTRGHNRLLIGLAGGRPFDWPEARGRLRTAGVPDLVLENAHLLHSA